MARRMLCLSGSYRPAGITEQALGVITEAAQQSGWECQTLRLREQNIQFCTNCRACTQTPGPQRGACPLNDDVAALVAAVEHCDALVLAAPTNFYDVTAITRTFLERLLPCAYWPWGQPGPRWRTPAAVRPSLLITSTAMPGLLARGFTRSMKSLADLSKCLRAKPVDRVYLGLVAGAPQPILVPRAQRRLLRATHRLLRAAETSPS